MGPIAVWCRVQNDDKSSDRQELNLTLVDACIIVQFIKKKTNKMQQCVHIFIIPYLYEAQHVSGNTPPIIRSLKLHWQPLVLDV